MSTLKRRTVFFKTVAIISAVPVFLIALGSIMINTMPRNVKYGATYFMGICLEDHMTRYDYKAKTNVRSARQDMLTDEEISAAIAMYAEQIIQSTARSRGIDPADLKVSDIRFTSVCVSRFENRVMPNVLSYIYNTVNGEILGVMEFRRYDDGAVKCNAIELSTENNGIMQAFAEHPGEDLVCV